MANISTAQPSNKPAPIWNRRILQLRASTDLTDKEWCEAIGVVQANMNGYREGSRSFTIKQLIKAAKMYNTSLDYLCGLTDQKTRNDKKQTPLEMIEEGLRMLKTKDENKARVTSASNKNSNKMGSV